MSKDKTPPTGDKKTISPQAKKHLVLLIVNTLLFFTVYRVLLHFTYQVKYAFLSFLVMLLYFALLLGFVLAYLIYNRFLSRKGLTMEDLNPEWSEEEKERYLKDGNDRLEKSKWMMTVILPLVLTFLFDIIDLYFIQGLLQK